MLKQNNNQSSIKTYAEYVAFFMLLFTLRAMDLFLTYKITPDLTLEWNPLVSYFSLSWRGFIIIQACLVLFALIGYHGYAQRTRHPVQHPGLNIFRFVYYYFNDRDASWSNFLQSFYRRPAKRYFEASSALLGFVIITSFTLVSLFAIAHNALILAGVVLYLDFVVEHGHFYFFSVFTLLVFSSAGVFFVTEFSSYKKRDWAITANNSHQ